MNLLVVVDKSLNSINFAATFDDKKTSIKKKNICAFTGFIVIYQFITEHDYWIFHRSSVQFWNDLTEELITVEFYVNRFPWLDVESSECLVTEANSERETSYNLRKYRLYVDLNFALF